MKFDIKTFLKKNWKLVLAILYVLAPTDLLPDFLPALGLSDDIVVLLGTLLLSYLEYRKEQIKKTSPEEVRKKHSTVVDGELVD